MPLVTIKLARRDPATEPAAEGSADCGNQQALGTTLGKRGQDVVVRIDELDPDNRGQRGKSAIRLRLARAVDPQQGDTGVPCGCRQPNGTWMARLDSLRPGPST